MGSGWCNARPIAGNVRALARPLEMIAGSGAADVTGLCRRHSPSSPGRL